MLHWQKFPDRILNKEWFGIILTPVWQKTMPISNIVNGFAACGIYPSNRNAITETGFLPNMPSQRPEPNVVAGGQPDDELVLGDLPDDKEPDTDDCLILRPSSSSLSNSQSISLPLSTTLSPSSNNVPALSAVSLSSLGNIMPPFSTVSISPSLTERRRKMVKKAMN